MSDNKSPVNFVIEKLYNSSMYPTVGISAHFVGHAAEMLVITSLQSIPGTKYIKIPLAKITHEFVENLVSSPININMFKNGDDLLEATKNFFSPVVNSPVETIFSMGFSYSFELLATSFFGLEACKCNHQAPLEEMVYCGIINAENTISQSENHKSWIYTNLMKGIASSIGSLVPSIFIHLYEDSSVQHSEISESGTVNNSISEL